MGSVQPVGTLMVTRTLVSSDPAYGDVVSTAARTTRVVRVPGAYGAATEPVGFGCRANPA